MDPHRLFRYLAVAALAATYVTILLGGNVMASDSGLACPDWPTCHGTLTPPLSGPTGVEWTHRLSALATSLLVGAVAVTALAVERRRPVLLRLALASAAAVVSQAVLGGIVVESDLAVLVVLAHLALATVLFALLLALALLANLRHVPRRWRSWALEASVEHPPAEGPLPAVPAPATGPETSPAPPSPA